MEHGVYFARIPLASTESHGHAWLQGRLENVVFIVGGHVPSKNQGFYHAGEKETWMSLPETGNVARGADRGAGGGDKSVLGWNQFGVGGDNSLQALQGCTIGPQPCRPSHLTFSRLQTLASHGACQVGGCIPRPRGHVNLL